MAHAQPGQDEMSKEVTSGVLPAGDLFGVPSHAPPMLSYPPPLPTSGVLAALRSGSHSERLGLNAEGKDSFPLATACAVLGYLHGSDTAHTWRTNEQFW